MRLAPKTLQKVPADTFEKLGEARCKNPVRTDLRAGVRPTTHHTLKTEFQPCKAARKHHSKPRSARTLAALRRPPLKGSEIGQCGSV